MIRAATPLDVPSILGLIQELAEYEKLRDSCISTESLVHEALFGSNPSAESVVAEISGEVIGFALYFTNFSTFLGRTGMYLEDVYVKPEYRNRGIGKQILKKLATICLERGYGRFEWSVLDWNEPSIKFYKSLGAVAMDEWTVYRLSGEALRSFAEDDFLNLNSEQAEASV
jgi:GNAT superfamily N-acetyltransferase